MLHVIFPFLWTWEGRWSGNDVWLAIKVELVFGPQGRGIKRVFVLLNWFSILWESLDEGVWWTLLSSVVDVSSTLLSQLEKKKRSDQSLFWKFSEQGMSSAISLYFSFILCSFPLQEWLLNNTFGGDASNIIYVHFTNFKIKEMLI